ncbi:MAG: hypothetical protein QF369_05255, partial [Dehalococcoidales bacterium]|nr:hypothetical protein [Dehalococcoidales bacterium]
EAAMEWQELMSKGYADIRDSGENAGRTNRGGFGSTARLTPTMSDLGKRRKMWQGLKHPI